MKIFVTGRSGQLARSLEEAGVGHGMAIVLAGRPAFDLRDAGSVTEAISRERPDLVINSAAYTQVDKAESEEAAARTVNAEGAARVARACAAQGIPLIHLSTDYVFDGEKDGSYREGDSTAPINAYGRSKLAGERIVAAICGQHLIIRTSWIFSRWGNNFLKSMLRLAATKSEIGVVSDQYGCPTYAPHLASALLDLATRAIGAPAAMTWGVYHAAGAGDASRYDLARELFRRAADFALPRAAVVPVMTAAHPTPARRPRNSRLDCNELYSQFGIRLPAWQTGVRECVARLASEQAAGENAASPAP